MVPSTHLVPRSARWLQPAWLLGLAACGGGAAAAPTPASLGPFDAERAWSHLVAQVEIGPRPAGSAGAELCVQLIEARLEELGLSPVRETFVATPPRDTGLAEQTLKNVVCEIEHPAPAGEVRPLVIVGAHFDTKRWTKDSGLQGHVLGANDGASGVAVLLELARLLKQVEPRPVDYRLVFFDGEEAFRWDWYGTDNRYGSRHHAQQLRKSDDRQRAAAMVLVDLVADAELELVRDSNSDPQLLGLFWRAADELGLGRFVQKRGSMAVLDDHLSFKEIGIPVADLIDLNYPDASRRYWHTDHDTLEHVSQQSLEVVGRILVHGLELLEAELASR